jgi:phage/plasmid-associated DNA primase
MPTWTLWIDSNFLLPVPEADDAFWRRVHAIRFKNKILANKPKIFFKNWEEYGPKACLKWAAEGANRILHKYTDISDIPVISDSVQEWRNTIEENSVYEFLKKLQNSDKFVQRNIIWNFYKEWSIANNVPTVSKNVFYELLDQNFRKTTIKGQRGYYVDIIEEQKEISFYGLS